MPNKTRDRMYDDLKGVHDAMLGSIKLFMTGRAIKATAGAYLSQLASLHVSVMSNLSGSVASRPEGDRYVFQTVSGPNILPSGSMHLPRRPFSLECLL